MEILIAKPWEDYMLLDSGRGKRLEKFGPYTLVRPDPQAIWQQKLPETTWHHADAVFEKNAKQDPWQYNKTLPKKWLMQFEDLSFWVQPTSFKHMGVFPEQSVHWQWLQKKITSAQRPVTVLNLFGYTGIATLAAAAAGAAITHVDASKPSITWARENQKASKLLDKQIRWIPDDVLTFMRREIRRGNTYDAIIMDPPIYGHGLKGEVWHFHEQFPQLLELAKTLLSKDPLFILANAYAISSSALMLQNLFTDFFETLGGNITSGELAIEERSGRLFSTGIFSRWEAK